MNIMNIGEPRRLLSGAEKSRRQIVMRRKIRMSITKTHAQIKEAIIINENILPIHVQHSAK